MERIRSNIQIIAEVVEDDVATKEDLKKLGTHLESEMSKLEYRIVIKLSAIVGGMITLAIASRFSALLH
jgi:hypothetical protein